MNRHERKDFQALIISLIDRSDVKKFRITWKKYDDGTEKEPYDVRPDINVTKFKNA